MTAQSQSSHKPLAAGSNPAAATTNSKVVIPAGSNAKSFVRY